MRPPYIHSNSVTNQTTLWLGGLETWEDETYLFLILQQLLPVFCAITNVTIVRDPTSEVSMGYGFVDFTSHQAAEVALQICRKTVRPGHTRPFRIAWAASNTFSHKRASNAILASPMPNMSPGPAVQQQMLPQQQSAPGQTPLAVSNTPNYAQDENLTLYVTPLEKHITKFTLAEEIKKFGYTSIISIKIAHNENGISRGFGFIRFGNKDEFNDALERLKTLRMGENQQPLHVTVARSNSYDPGYTLTNEMLFGTPGQQGKRGSMQMLGYPKKQRRVHQPGMPSPYGNQPAMNRNISGNMHMKGVGPVNPNPYDTPSVPLESPPMMGSSSYMMPSGMAIPAPPSLAYGTPATPHMPPMGPDLDYAPAGNHLGPNNAVGNNAMSGGPYYSPAMPGVMSAPSMATSPPTPTANHHSSIPMNPTPPSAQYCATSPRKATISAPAMICHQTPSSVGASNPTPISQRKPVQGSTGQSISEYMSNLTIQNTNDSKKSKPDLGNTKEQMDNMSKSNVINTTQNIPNLRMNSMEIKSAHKASSPAGRVGSSMGGYVASGGPYDTAAASQSTPNYSNCDSTVAEAT